MYLDHYSPKGQDERSKKELLKENKDLSKEIVNLTNLLQADGTRSLLVIFQGMDASGKDGSLRDTFKGINPANISVHSFKKPNSEEMAHDFLWRVHKVCPKKGMVKIFNRSQYEDILVPSVEGFIDVNTISKRYETINQFEQMLEENGTKVLKFYLNISKERQREKLQGRIDEPEKHWKHNDGDWAVREKWDQYMKVYDSLFTKCNTIPWHIIPADNSKLKVNTIAKIVIKELEAMNLKWPALDSDRF
ncbi:MAG: PPK2 family polyphosphate:nucleotide phosphotransferase [Flavobacteriales bacterium]|jgi:PPK2 family polyphosphate:nucleotide phosphotransferase